MPSLTDAQKDVVRGIIKGLDKNDYQTLGGYAGTGKTVCVGVLTEVEKLSGFAVCAYTGKAANVLRRRGVSNASTIHSLIYRPITEDGTVTWRLASPAEVECDGFIVDEASMVSEDIHRALLTFGRPIVYVGDHGQLEPIGTDFNVMKNPMYRLEEVHRNAGPIAHFAEHLRFGRPAHSFADGGDQVFLAAAREVTDNHLVATDQVIAAYNRFRCDMNNRIRRTKWADRRIEMTDAQRAKYEGDILLMGKDDADKVLFRDHGIREGGGIPLVVEGERVMCLRNNKKIGLFNGMQATVTKVHRWNFFDIMSDDGREFKKIKYIPEQFGAEKNDTKFDRDGPVPFDYAYCCTCHKAQGDEWQNVIIYEQLCDKWDHKRWAYTAASRAKNNLIWVLNKPRPAQAFVPDWLQ